MYGLIKKLVGCSKTNQSKTLQLGVIMSFQIAFYNVGIFKELGDVKYFCLNKNKYFYYISEY